MGRGVEAEAKGGREDNGTISDLEDRLEADALAPDLAATRSFARLAHLAHGIQVLGLEAALVVVGDEGLW